MNHLIRVRSLTKQELEDKNFNKKEVGQLVVALGRPISIMGNADHAYVRSLNIDMSKQWTHEYLGGGQYLYDGPAPPAAIGGRTSLVLWGASDAFTYVNMAARELGIQIYFDSDLMYFESTYADAFFEAFSYVDRTLHGMNESSFFLSRFFGGGVPALNSKESKVIQQNVCKLLTREIRR